MAVLKCRVCGGELEINEDRTIGVCKYCGATNTIPQDPDLSENLSNRSVFPRLDGEPDDAEASPEAALEKLLQNGETFLKLDNLAGAEEAYKRAANEYPSDYRGWWGLILCSTRNLESVSGQQEQVDTWYGYVKTLAPAAVLSELEPRYVEYLKLVARVDVQNALAATRSLKESLENSIVNCQEELRQSERAAEEKQQRIRNDRQGEAARCEAAVKEAEKQCRMWLLILGICIACGFCAIIWLRGRTIFSTVLIIAIPCAAYVQYQMKKSDAHAERNKLNRAQNALYDEELKLQKMQRQHQPEAGQREHAVEEAKQQIRECEFYLGNSPEVLQYFFHSIRCEKIGVTVRVPENISISLADWEIDMKFSRHWYVQTGGNGAPQT